MTQPFTGNTDDHLDRRARRGRGRAGSARRPPPRAGHDLVRADALVRDGARLAASPGAAGAPRAPLDVRGARAAATGPHRRHRHHHPRAGRLPADVGRHLDVRRHRAPGDRQPARDRAGDRRPGRHRRRCGGGDRAGRGRPRAVGPGAQRAVVRAGPGPEDRRPGVRDDRRGHRLRRPVLRAGARRRHGRGTRSRARPGDRPGRHGTPRGGPRAGTGRPPRAAGRHRDRPVHAARTRRIARRLGPQQRHPAVRPDHPRRPDVMAGNPGPLPRRHRHVGPDGRPARPRRARARASRSSTRACSARRSAACCTNAPPSATTRPSCPRSRAGPGSPATCSTSCSPTTRSRQV